MAGRCANALAPHGKSMADQALQKNLILARLDPADFALLSAHLEPAELPLRKVLEKRGQAIKTVYFPESGFASVVANGGTRPIEVGLIGREGMTGLPILLGGDHNTNEVFIQAAGKGQCMPARDLRHAIAQSHTLHQALLRFVNAFLSQVTNTAVANGRSKIEERLARWLLMADDRIDEDELSITHEFLAMMLSVRRAGVTMAIHALENDGVITKRRGRIVICDRDNLKRMSNGIYLPADYR